MLGKVLDDTIHWIDHDKVEEILSSIPTLRDKLIFSLIYAYGLRVSELINLTLPDIDLDHHQIKIMPLKKRKSRENRKRVFPLSPKLESMLKDWLAERPTSNYPNLIVCYSYENGYRVAHPMSRINIFKLFRKYASKVGVPTMNQHPHALRHSIAVAMASKGVDIYFTKEFLRHTSINSTQEYYDISNKLRQEKTLELHNMLNL